MNISLHMIHLISRNVPQGLISATYHHPSIRRRKFCVRGSFLNRSTHLVAPCLASSSIACWIKWTSAWTSLCCSFDVPCILISVHRALSRCPWTKCHLGDSGINGTAHHQLWHQNNCCEYARDIYQGTLSAPQTRVAPRQGSATEKHYLRSRTEHTPSSS